MDSYGGRQHISCEAPPTRNGNGVHRRQRITRRRTERYKRLLYSHACSPTMVLSLGDNSRRSSNQYNNVNRNNHPYHSPATEPQYGTENSKLEHFHHVRETTQVPYTTMLGSRICSTSSTVHHAFYTVASSYSTGGGNMLFQRQRHNSGRNSAQRSSTAAARPRHASRGCRCRAGANAGLARGYAVKRAPTRFGHHRSPPAPAPFSPPLHKRCCSLVYPQIFPSAWRHAAMFAVRVTPARFRFA
jgi:hypothetical protein